MSYFKQLTTKDHTDIIRIKRLFLNTFAKDTEHWTRHDTTWEKETQDEKLKYYHTRIELVDKVLTITITL